MRDHKRCAHYILARSKTCIPYTPYGMRAVISPAFLKPWAQSNLGIPFSRKAARILLDRIARMRELEHLRRIESESSV